ncbi:MAG: hypothetical protein A2Y17_08855 [Clostridiales bacterium GWF2_38_85]|nr:MAG: hypothetical protein A2Y17_08855 [Clostridiales bacterium GWF2_38_85]HBL83695.1 hypothetical protein [Clostridiales bacterium]
MNWEKLTVDEFKNSISETGRVCIVPIGCLEKHGNHLPLGTDIAVAREIAERAAKTEPVMIFPYYPIGMVSEVRHKLGTVAIPPALQMSLLYALCDEISRNGYKKIIIANGHGGNNMFLRYFAQATLQERHDYSVYVNDIWALTYDQSMILEEKYGKILDCGHADVYETSDIMAISPEQVHMERVKVDESKSTHRMDSLDELQIFTAINWYGDFPHQFAGDPSNASAEYGNDILNYNAENLVKVIREIKKSNLVGDLFDEFYNYSDNPTV